MNTTDGIISTSDEDVALISPRRMRIDPSHDSAEVTVNETLEDLEPIGETPAVPIGEAEIVQPAMLEIEEPTEAMISAVAGENPEIRQEQLQLEAAQLADHLRERLREIDRREAMVHARVAQLESDLRTSRIWLAERHAEFESREAELLYQIADLQEQATQRGQEIGTAELAAEARHIRLRSAQTKISAPRRAVTAARGRAWPPAAGNRSPGRRASCTPSTFGHSSGATRSDDGRTNASVRRSNWKPTAGK